MHKASFNLLTPCSGSNTPTCLPNCLNPTRSDGGRLALARRRALREADRTLALVRTPTSEEEVVVPYEALEGAEGAEGVAHVPLGAADSHRSSCW